MNVISYHVYSTEDGGEWLSDDEKTWTSRFDESAGFTSYALAADIAAREAAKGKRTSHMVFAWVGG